MKKIIGALGIIALAWLAAYSQQHDVPRKAWAGITCSLPIVLVNGTTADAGQVMQNFNALSTCFNSVATVNSVTCGPGLDGGIITGAGTCSLSAARRTNPTSQLFLGSSGTYTTPANVLWIELHMIAGGGGGSGYSSGPTFTNGSNGTVSTFGSSTTNFGLGATSSGGGIGGAVGSGCTINLAGADGTVGSASLSGSFAGTGGAGASTPFGGGGQGAYGANGGGFAAKANTGAGGGGAGFNSGATTGPGYGGGAGSYCYQVIGNPPATISYAVGSGGAGGVSNAGLTGGTGGSGIILVVEHYN